VIGIVATYLIHSTVWLGIAWVVDYRYRLRRISASEQVWKCAAVFAVVTPVVQVGIVAAYPQLHLAPVRLLASAEGRSPVAGLGDTESQERLERTLPGQEIRQKEPPIRIPKGLPHAIQESQRETKEVIQEEAAFGGDNNRMVTLEASNVPGVRFSRGDLREIVCSPQSVTARAAVFGLGVCLVVGVSLVVMQLLRLHSCFLGAELLSSGPLRESLDDLLQRSSITRTVRLLSATNCSEPLAFGFFRWNIVLPKHTIGRLGAAEIDALLAHEMAHLVRHDFWWLWVGNMLCCCAPFQPLNFLARRRWQQAAEYLCDDWAVDHGVESLCLARCLVRIAEWRLKPQPCLAVFASGPAHSILFHRVTRLISRESNSDGLGWHRRGAGITVAMVASLLVLFAPCAASLPITPASISIGGPNAELGENAALLDKWEELNAELQQLDDQLTLLPGLARGVATDSSKRRLLREIYSGARRLREERDEVRRIMHGGRKDRTQ
jgi:hypothetical protein